MSGYVVGLTGGIGSGKSTVARLFAERGVAVIDTDEIAHALTAPGGAAMPAIRERFGACVIAPNGALDRQAMRQLAFADPACRQALEAILHPRIRAEADRLVAAAASDYVLLAIPLLVETGGYRDRLQRVLVVDCEEATQVSRVVARNGLAEAEVRRILAAQASRAQRLAVADDVVRNDHDPQALVAQVDALHARYLALAAGRQGSRSAG